MAVAITANLAEARQGPSGPLLAKTWASHLHLCVVQGQGSERPWGHLSLQGTESMAVPSLSIRRRASPT